MLTLSVTTLNAQPLTDPLAAEFGDAGGTIGRAPENSLVLVDPDRKISRTHASVSFRDGTYTLRDQGSVVPVFLNGQPMGNGRELPLKNGDEIRIAGYAMRVALAAVAAPVEAPAPASLLDDATEDRMAAPVLSWTSAAPAGAAEGITTVILTTAGKPVPAPVARAAASTTPAAAPVAAPAAAPPMPATASSADTDALLAGLLKGAGLRDVVIPGGLTPELMHQVGTLLHEATRGLLDLLAARAETKREVRADMTVIVASDNNPLKFAPSLDAALTGLLVPRGRGFMPPLRAVGDAYDDLRAHQQGFMEGMRSALAVVLSRFNPESLEQRLAERSVVDSFLPGNRKAKLWDQFGQLYGEISKDAESDFHKLFGQEFLKAYHARVAKAPAAGR